MTHVQDILEQADHRPWPLPEQSWAMSMRWEHLLFAHWPIDPEILRPLIPRALDLDVFEGDGCAYLGIVPFEMHDVKPRRLPGVPGHTNFLEANVRTYVRYRGEKPGVFFFSLDAESILAVETARHMFYLPYFHAQMSDSLDESTGCVHYQSTRKKRGANTLAALDITYHPTGEVYRAQTGDLDHWLTERYCLYVVHPRNKDQVHIGEIHHESWPLQPAEAVVANNTMTAPLGFDLPNDGCTPPLLHYARLIDVVAWSLRRI